jgi:hypothetical protein
MPPKFLHVKFMFTQPEPEDSSDSDESLSGVMDDFKKQMREIERASKSIDSQVTQLYTRAKEEAVDWLSESLTPKPALKAWLKSRGLPPRPNMDEFLDACYSAAKSMDLESRILIFHKADAVALWGGQRRLTVFEMVALIPTLFE